MCLFFSLFLLRKLNDVVFWKYKTPRGGRGAAGDETLASNHLELNLVSRIFL